MKFHDRVEAGQRLALLLGAYVHRPDVLALGLTRGGVPVAYEVARALSVPLDIIVVRKLGAPFEPELAMGAIAYGGVRVLNEHVIREFGISREAVEAATATEQRELTRREHLYRGDRPFPEIRGRTVILIDDGIATGSTMRAAIAVVRQQQPARIVIATPVAASSTCDELRGEVDEFVCDLIPEELYGVGLWYDRFPQVSDETVRSLVAKAREDEAARLHESPATPQDGLAPE